MHRAHVRSRGSCYALLLKAEQQGFLHALETIAAKHGVTDEAIAGHRRSETLLVARAELWHHLFYAKNWTMIHIAQTFQRDVQTIRAGLDRYDAILARRRAETRTITTTRRAPWAATRQPHTAR